MFAIAVLALAIRLTNLTATSLWIDEIYSFIVASGHLPPTHLSPIPQTAAEYYQQFLTWQPLRLPDLIAALKINVHMPLYYLLLNPWLGWLGSSAWALRSFSALCSTLMVFPLYSLGKALGGRRAGIFTALMAALLPFQIYYGQEGRMYALSLLCAAFAALSFWKLLYSRRPLIWSLLYTLSVTAGILSHYMFVFFLGFQGVYALVWLILGLRKKSSSENAFNAPDKTTHPIFQPERVLWFLLPLLAFAAIAYCWFPIYLAQQQGVNEEYHFAKGLVGATRYPTVLVWQPLIVVAGANPLSRIFYIPVTILLSALCFWRRKPSSVSPSITTQAMDSPSSITLADRASQPSVASDETDASENANAPPAHWFQREGFLLLWTFVPLLLQIGYDLIKHTHISVIDRYALLISPALCLIMGLGLARLSNWRRNADELTKSQPLGRKITRGILGVMCLLAVGMVMKPSPFRDEHNKDKDIRGKIHYMAKHARAGDLIVANGPFGAPNILAYYLVAEPPTQTAVDSRQLPILYWISEHYGTHPAFPSDTIFQPYKRVWFFRYRANNERGLQICKDHLKTLYPHAKELQNWLIYTLNGTTAH